MCYIFGARGRKWTFANSDGSALIAFSGVSIAERPSHGWRGVLSSLPMYNNPALWLPCQNLLQSGRRIFAAASFASRLHDVSRMSLLRFTKVLNMLTHHSRTCSSTTHLQGIRSMSPSDKDLSLHVYFEQVRTWSSKWFRNTCQFWTQYQSFKTTN